MAKGSYIDSKLRIVSDVIVAKLQQLEQLKWEQPWVNVGVLPYNLSGRRYSGTNTAFLHFLTEEKRYAAPIYMTFLQAKDAGLQIKKGEKAFPVFYHNVTILDSDKKEVSPADYKLLSKEDRLQCTVKSLLRVYDVFNIDQTTMREISPDKYNELISKDKFPEKNYYNDTLSTMLEKQSWVCPIEFYGDAAQYSLMNDIITLPKPEQFKTQEGFFGTLLHEMSHSTGHEKRLDRHLSSVKADITTLAREELIAELGSAFAGMKLGVQKTISDGNIAYVGSWIKSAKEDSQFVYKAVVDAVKAADFITEKLGIQSELDQTVEQAKAIIAEQGVSGQAEINGNAEIQGEQVIFGHALNSNDNMETKENLKSKIDRNLARVSKDGMMLQFVKEQTPEICMEAVKKTGLALEYVKEQTPGICMAAVKQDGYALEHVKKQTPEICTEAVKQNGWVLYYVKEQTPEICREAVKKNGLVLTLVKEQTPEICTEAVKQEGLALQYVKEQTPEICTAAVKQNGWALEHVKKQTPEICMAAVKQRVPALYYVKEQTPEICMAAIKQDREQALRFIRNENEINNRSTHERVEHNNNKKTNTIMSTKNFVGNSYKNEADGKTFYSFEVKKEAIEKLEGTGKRNELFIAIEPKKEVRIHPESGKKYPTHSVYAGDDHTKRELQLVLSKDDLLSAKPDEFGNIRAFAASRDKDKISSDLSNYSVALEEKDPDGKYRFIGRGYDESTKFGETRVVGVAFKTEFGSDGTGGKVYNLNIDADKVGKLSVNEYGDAMIGIVPYKENVPGKDGKTTENTHYLITETNGKSKGIEATVAIHVSNPKDKKYATIDSCAVHKVGEKEVYKLVVQDRKPESIGKDCADLTVSENRYSPEMKDMPKEERNAALADKNYIGRGWTNDPSKIRLDPKHDLTPKGLTAAIDNNHSTKVMAILDKQPTLVRDSHLKQLDARQDTSLKTSAAIVDRVKQALESVTVKQKKNDRPMTRQIRQV
jgi:antirestriction protein ArdC